MLKPMCLVRMGKVAKCVDSQFAERYYDDLTWLYLLGLQNWRRGCQWWMRGHFDGR